jgi:hypothetical protein
VDRAEDQVVQDRVLREGNEERRALRKQLRQRGWQVGEMEQHDGGVRLAFWPAPHRGPAPGVEPLLITAPDKTAAMRQAVATLEAQADPAT